MMASDDSVHARHGESWSEVEEANLVKLKKEGKTNLEVSDELNRTVNAIKSKLTRIKNQKDMKDIDNEPYLQNILNLLRSFVKSILSFFSFNAALSIIPIMILILLLTPIGYTELGDTYDYVPTTYTNNGNQILLDIAVEIEEIDFTNLEVIIEEVKVGIVVESEGNNREKIYTHSVQNLVVNDTQYLFLEDSIFLYIYFNDETFLSPDRFPIDSYSLNFEIRYLSDLLKNIQSIENYIILVDFHVDFSGRKDTFRKKISHHGIDFEEINDNMIFDSYNIEFIVGRSDYSKLFFLLPPIIFFSILTVNGYTRSPKEKLDNVIKISALNIGFMFSIVTLIPIENTITLAESLTMGTILYSLFQILITMVELNWKEAVQNRTLNEIQNITHFEIFLNHINKNVIPIWILFLGLFFWDFNIGYQSFKRTSIAFLFEPIPGIGITEFEQFNQEIAYYQSNSVLIDLIISFFSYFVYFGSMFLLLSFLGVYILSETSTVFRFYKLIPKRNTKSFLNNFVYRVIDGFLKFRLKYGFDRRIGKTIIIVLLAIRLVIILEWLFFDYLPIYTDQ